MDTFTLRPQGAFSLREAVQFGFGQRDAERYDGLMRLAFCRDDLQGAAGVVLRQDDDGVHGRIVADGPLDARTRAAVRDQAARVLSLDHDATAYDALVDADPVLRPLSRLVPGLRPPLFHSPYEAAAWSVISARRPAAQMMRVRERFAAAHGATLDVHGRPMAAFPTPQAIREIESVDGLDAVKVRRLQGVAKAAERGRLDVDRLRTLGPEVARKDLQTLDGIGPFYATLVTVRAVGFTDVLPAEEPRLLAAVGDRYGLGRAATAEELSDIAEDWRPFRTWASVLLRATAGRPAP